MMQKAYTLFEIKAVDTKNRLVTGLASTWNADLDGERFAKGAFKKSVAEFNASRVKRYIPIIDQHNYKTGRAVFGKAEELAETDTGLRVKFSVIDTPDGNEYFERIKGGYLNGLSVGFQTVGSTTEEKIITDGKEKKIRVIKEAKLMEISCVIWGANPEALIDGAAVKALFKAAQEEEPKPEEDAEPVEEPAEEPAEEEPTEDAEEVPPEIEAIEKELADIIAMKEIAVSDEDYDAAAVLRAQERGLRDRLERKRKELAQKVTTPAWAPEDPTRLKAEALVASLRASVSRF